MPPSPVVITLRGWKEKQAICPARPADGLPLSVYPDLAARSARRILNEGDAMTICYARADWQVAWHAKLMNRQNGSGARGYGLKPRPGSTLKVVGSISTKTGVAPQYRMLFAVAMKE